VFWDVCGEDGGGLEVVAAFACMIFRRNSSRRQIIDFIDSDFRRVQNERNLSLGLSG
jgi:hypothetical protein